MTIDDALAVCAACERSDDPVAESAGLIIREAVDDRISACANCGRLFGGRRGQVYCDRVCRARAHRFRAQAAQAAVTVDATGPEPTA